ncbi:unnamed protein product, partial [Closterium sp. NIES-54]
MRRCSGSGVLVPLFAICPRKSSPPCVFPGFTPDAHGWQFYHPTSRRVFPSPDVTFDESVPFYRLFPYRSTPPPPPPLFLAPGPPPVAIGSGAARGAATGQRARRQGGAVLTGRRRGADSLAGIGGWRGLPSDGGGRAGEPGGGPARQRLLASPDGDKRCLRRLGDEWRCQARVRANLLSAGQLKENGVKIQDDGGRMLLVAAAGDVLSRASYTRQVLCTDMRLCLTRSPTPPTEIVAQRGIVSATKSTPDMLSDATIRIHV